MLLEPKQTKSEFARHLTILCITPENCWYNSERAGALKDTRLVADKTKAFDVLTESPTRIYKTSEWYATVVNFCILVGL